ncbi:MAG: oxidoreductase, partial [SAR324 cluster bacterium]|nr:oxidoreductase [SAR324 cluster bacterium]
MKIILVGPGAFGKKHLDGLKHIEGVEVVALVGQPLEPTQAV